ncbi:MAG: hypothetical protein Q9168_003265 [Polycauliona sp. 1 TL-2023]
MTTYDGIDHFNEKLPHEMILQILSHVRRDRLKIVRLTCKKLAFLGGRLLVGRLYISPREKDMEVFDAVTRHPEISKSVKKIIFDSAQFLKVSLSRYLKQLDEKANETNLTALGATQGTADEVRLVLRRALAQVRPRYVDNDCEACQCLRLPIILQGYQQYSLAAQEQGNIFLSSWFSRVAEGLRRLGPIRSVSIENSWERSYDKGCASPNDRVTIAKSLGHDEAVAAPEIAAAFLAMFCIKRANRNPTSVSYPKLIHTDGTRTVGSPSARAWLPTTLPPTCPESIQDGRTDINYLMKTGRTTGYLEVVEFMKVLNMTQKWPVKLVAKRSLSRINTTGLPLDFFDDNTSSESAQFMQSSNRLRKLDLEIAGRHDDDYVEVRDLNILENFIKTARSLTSLRLSLPHEEDHNYLVPALSIEIIFPSISVATLHLPKLTKLSLGVIQFSYRDLAGLLFISLPGLAHLTLKRVELSSGRWSCIIEGLRRLKKLESCKFQEALFYTNYEYYTARKRLKNFGSAQAEFLHKNSEYVLGRLHIHPLVSEEENAEKDVAGMMLAHLNAKLDSIRKDKARSSITIV